jgi:CRP-like cAMP-binding protein
VPPKSQRSSNSQRNHLLAALPRGDLDLLLPHLESLDVEVRHSMEERAKPIRHIYFMEEGIASVVATAGDGKEVEVGLIGREGMTGMFVLMGNHQSPHQTYIQVRGRAQRMPVANFREAMEASGTLRSLLLRYVQAFTIQTTHTAIANARASVEQRLARWVLMAHDRVEGDELPLTHEFLSLMLAVRRPGVTVAVNELEGRGLLQANRGHLRIQDRKGIEKVAGGYYGVPEAELRRLMA